MKTVLKYIIYLTFIALSTFSISCKKDNTNTDTVNPPPSPIGKFYGLIDGDSVIWCSCQGIPDYNIYTYPSINYEITGYFQGTTDIYFYNWSFSFYGDTIGTYKVKSTSQNYPSPGQSYLIMGIGEFESNNPEVYYNAVSGYLTVMKIDKTKKLISGFYQFGVAQVNDGSAIKHVISGSFTNIQQYN